MTVLVAIAPATTVWLAFRSTDRLEAVTPDPIALEAEAQFQEFSDRQAVAVEPVYPPAVVLYAPTWVGTVTAVGAAPGAPLATGSMIVEVDGIDRLAYTAPSPLYRSLSDGVIGADVAVLHDVLHRLGVLSRPTESAVFDGATGDAVGRLAALIGLPEDTPTFDPAWLVWMPFEPLIVASVATVVGQLAPPAGAELVTVGAQLSGLELSSDVGLPDLAGRWILELSGTSVSLVDGQPSPDDLARLESLLPAGGEATSGIIVRAEARAAVTVAASGVSVGSDGQFCVWLPDGADGYQAAPVMLGDSLTSQVEVTSGVERGDSYLVNPGAILAEDGSCPSN